ncbi:MAG: hypothetical protein ABEJ83_04610 [Candidatus Nanohaloarchaea archaeon]
MSKEDKIDDYIQDLPPSYIASEQFTLPRDCLIKLKEKSLEEGWTLNQALTVLINRKLEEI